MSKQATDASGDDTWTYGRTFNAAPNILLTPQDTAVSGVLVQVAGAPGTTSVVVKSVEHDGTNEAIDYYATAEGVPAATDLKAKITLIGY